MTEPPKEPKSTSEPSSFVQKTIRNVRRSVDEITQHLDDCITSDSAGPKPSREEGKPRVSEIRKRLAQGKPDTRASTSSSAASRTKAGTGTAKASTKSKAAESSDEGEPSTPRGGGGRPITTTAVIEIEPRVEQSDDPDQDSSPV